MWTTQSIKSCSMNGIKVNTAQGFSTEPPQSSTPWVLEGTILMSYHSKNWRSNAKTGASSTLIKSLAAFISSMTSKHRQWRSTRNNTVVLSQSPHILRTLMILPLTLSMNFLQLALISSELWWSTRTDKLWWIHQWQPLTIKYYN